MKTKYQSLVVGVSFLMSSLGLIACNQTLDSNKKLGIFSQSASPGSPGGSNPSNPGTSTGLPNEFSTPKNGVEYEVYHQVYNGNECLPFYIYNSGQISFYYQVEITKNDEARVQKKIKYFKTSACDAPSLYLEVASVGTVIFVDTYNFELRYESGPSAGRNEKIQMNSAWDGFTLDSRDNFVWKMKYGD